MLLQRPTHQTVTMPDQSLVITDTSVLIAFDQIGCLEILPGMFDQIVAPPAVVAEFGSRPRWLQDVELRDAALVAEHRAHFLDQGEAEAIALAREHEGAVLLLDERRGRRYAQTLGLPVVGTAGLLVQAKRSGLIREVRPLLDALRDSGFRLSERVYARAVVLAGEVVP